MTRRERADGEVEFAHHAIARPESVMRRAREAKARIEQRKAGQAETPAAAARRRMEASAAARGIY